MTGVSVYRHVWAMFVAFTNGRMGISTMIVLVVLT